MVLKSFCSWLSVGDREPFYITSKTSCRGSCQLPLQNCSKDAVTMVAVAEFHEASAKASPWVLL